MKTRKFFLKKTSVFSKYSYRKLFILTGILFVFTSCTKFDPRLNPESNQSNLKQEEVNDASIHQFQTSSYTEKTLKWNIKSDLAKVFKAKERTYLNKVSLTFYDNQRNPVSFIIADRAILLTDTQDIELLGNVNIRNTKGTTLNGDYFYWNNTTEELTSPRKVVLKKKNGFTVSGVGFSTDKNIEAIHFNSQVSGEVVEKSATEKDFFNVEF